MTGSECALIVLTAFWTRTSQTLTVSSNDPVASSVFDGFRQQQNTYDSWPSNDEMGWPRATSHSRTVLSSDAVQQYDASMLHAMSLMPSQCASSGRAIVHVSGAVSSKSSHRPSAPHTASRSPVGAHLTQLSGFWNAPVSSPAGS